VDNVVADAFSRNPNSPLDEGILPDTILGTAAQYLSRLTTAPCDDYKNPPDDPSVMHIAAQSFVEATMTDDQYQTIQRVHNAVVGHHGVERTVAALRNLDYDWPHMRNQVKTFLRQCACCQKQSLRNFKVQTSPFTTGGKYPFESIAFDHAGPFAEDADGNKYALVVMDLFSRFIDVYATRSNDAPTTVTHLIKHFARYATPAHIHTDKGPAMKSEIMQELVKQLDAHHTISTPDSHQESSPVERSIKEINRWVRDLVYEKHKGDTTRWASLLPYAMRIHNATKIESLGYSPARIIFGTSIDLEPSIFCDRVLRSRDDMPINLWMHDQTVAQQVIMDRARATQDRLNALHLAKPVVPTEYKTGSLVLLSMPVSRFGDGRPTKFDSLYRGPYKVLGHKEQSYRLQSLTTGKEITPKNIHLLKPFYYDKRRTDPMTVALQDSPDVFLVDAIEQHRGNLQGRKDQLSFLVRWSGYEEPTWEPWAHVRDNSVLHTYLKDRGHENLIPRKFQV
jgi:hypothetical protein